MKSQILTAVKAILIVLCQYPVLATANTYYFSSSGGDDSRSATEARNPATPWRSLDKLNAYFPSLQGGDTIAFKSGDIFDGHILAASSGSPSNPIVLTSFGTGGKPVINGFYFPSSWENSGNGIWETQMPSTLSGISLVTLNNIVVAKARYPNADEPNGGYLTFESHSGNSSITDNQLNSANNWSGSEVVIRKNRWVLDCNPVTQHNGNTVHYTSESGNNASDNFGYFFQNDRKAVDRDGEWYFDRGTHKLGIRYPGNPSAAVGVAVQETLVFIYNYSNIVFSNLAFRGAAGQCFLARSSSGITIDHCDISFSGVNAIDASGVQGLSVTNCDIRYTNNIALRVENCPGARLSLNHIRSTGTIAGMGKGDSGSYEAILLTGDNSIVEQNSIDSTGYIPITFSGNNVRISNNVIRYFAFVKDDGGGIYTWNNAAGALVNTGRQINGNLVFNGVGAGAGTDNPAMSLAHGIYIDDNSANVSITGNSIAGCGFYGIYLHNARSITLRDNVVFDNFKQVGMIHDNIAASAPLNNISSRRNIFFSKSATQQVADFITIDNSLHVIGTMDSNLYCRPANEDGMIWASWLLNGTASGQSLGLEEWQAVVPFDAQSTGTPVTLSPYTVNSINGGNRYNNGRFLSNINGLYAWSQANNCNASWTGTGLDTGTLKLSFSSITGSSNPSSTIIGIGGVAANKNYLLRYSSRGTVNNRSVSFYLRKSNAPYDDLSVRVNRKIKNVRTENELLLVANSSEPQASLVADIQEQTGAVYLDNIELVEANVTPANYDDSIRFEYNVTPQPKTVTLPGIFVDVKTGSFTGTITLPPFSSAVLIRKDGPLQALPVHFVSFTGEKANNEIRLKWTVGDNEFPARFEIQRGRPDGSFDSIGTVTAMQQNGTVNYSFTDAHPMAGANRYRIKWRGGSGGIVFSKVITVFIPGPFINSGPGITIFPNPAPGKAYVCVTNADPGGYLLLRAANGNLVQKIAPASQTTEVALDVFPKGTYIVQYVYAGRILSAKLVHE